MRSAYTLIEVLAVVVLVGMVFAALVPGLAGASDAARLDRLVADLIDLDARARMLATRGDGCVIEQDREKGTIVLTQPGMEEQQAITVSIPESVAVEVQGEAAQVVFDRLGETSSYGYRVTAPSERVALVFNGHSGWYELTRGGEDE